MDIIEKVKRKQKLLLYNRRCRWGSQVAEMDMFMEKHILPRIASDILLPIEELDHIADKIVILGKRGEDIYNKGVELGCSDLWKHRIVRNCLQLERYTQVLRDIAEQFNRGPLELFPVYDSLLVSTEPVLSTEEKVNEMFRESLNSG